MFKKITFVAMAFLTINLCHASESSASKNSMNAALSLAFETIYEKAEGPGGGPFNPVLVIADNVQPLDGVSAFKIPLVIKSRNTAKNEQLAWFLYVSKISFTETELELKYDKPYNGKFGTVKLAKTGETWALVDHQAMHSSSGARMFYGELYEGVTCKDGAEMALRWNGYIDAIEAFTAKRPRKELKDLPSKCAGDVFPDVAAYLQAKQLGIVK